MLFVNDRSQLFTKLHQGAAVITPNNRLSSQLLQDYYQQNQTDVQTKPNCLPYQTFLRDQYQKIRHINARNLPPVLLTPSQERYLWRRLLTESYGHCHNGLLQEVHSAWVDCQHWNLDPQHPAFSCTPQTQLFQNWCQAIQETLDSLDAISEAQLESYLSSHAALFNFNALFWVCFDDYTPAQRRLQAAIEARGIAQYHYDLPGVMDNDATNPPAHTYTAENPEAEYDALIAWLTNKLAAGEKRIGVVVPDLQTESTRLQRRMEQSIPTHAYNISLGKALIENPLITHAIHWLCLDKQTISHHEVRLLLQSPYLTGAQAECIERAQFMHDSALLKEPKIPVKTLITALEPLAPILAKLLNTLSDYPSQATPTEWVTHFKARLLHLGFPGDYPLSSSTYQYFQRGMALLEELMPLSLLETQLTQENALKTLQNLAETTIFQIKTPTAPIQILGLLEASGCLFDSIWICGITDQCLPKATRLSAFIPLELQRQYHMPRSIPQRELALAQTLLQRLRSGSLDTIFSYPKLIEDRPQLPSPLIAQYPKHTLSILEPRTNHTATQCFEDTYTLPLLENERVTGGSTLLANQAKCPFRAFAAHRLHAKSSQTVSDGPDASERGQTMHRAMEVIWRHLKTHKNLLTLSQTLLNQQIDQAIEQAVLPLLKERPYSFPPMLQTVEKRRLRRIIQDALDWEKQRPPFTVEAIEQDVVIPLAGIDFRVRIDRLDRVASDETWVIDYKTRLPLQKPWNEPRPEAPQLLLYSLLDDSIHALLFLQLQAGHVRCSGLSATNSDLPNINSLKKGESWSDRKHAWEAQLTELAEEFRSGHCPPAPNKTTHCQTCDFPSLCRTTMLRDNP